MTVNIITPDEARARAQVVLDRSDEIAERLSELVQEECMRIINIHISNASAKGQLECVAKVDLNTVLRYYNPLTHIDKANIKEAKRRALMHFVRAGYDHGGSDTNDPFTAQFTISWRKS